MKKRNALISILGLLSVIFTLHAVQVSAQPNLSYLVNMPALQAQDMFAEKQRRLDEQMIAIRATNDFRIKNPTPRPDSPEKALARKELQARQQKIRDAFVKEQSAAREALLIPRPIEERRMIMKLVRERLRESYILIRLEDEKFGNEWWPKEVEENERIAEAARVQDTQ